MDQDQEEQSGGMQDGGCPAEPSGRGASLAVPGQTAKLELVYGVVMAQNGKRLKLPNLFDRFVRDPLRVGYREVREARMAGKGALSGPPALLEVFITGKTSDL
ncbi:hypothetical protein DTO207G8_6458 [Paecilomyces variotii]|nr:hypothetical protein DTO207G8_6458 [Paecilomyces variotii]